MNYLYRPIRKKDGKSVLYLIGSWLMLIIGWIGLGVLTFPIGLYLADASTAHGGDGQTVYNLHKWSFVIFMIPLIFAIVLVIFWIAVTFSTSLWSFLQGAV